MIHCITYLIRFRFFKRKLESKSLRYIYRGEKFVYFFDSFKLCPIEGDQRRENSKFYSSAILSSSLTQQKFSFSLDFKTAEKSKTSPIGIDLPSLFIIGNLERFRSSNSWPKL